MIARRLLITLIALLALPLPAQDPAPAEVHPAPVEAAPAEAPPVPAEAAPAEAPPAEAPPAEAAPAEAPPAPPAPPPLQDIRQVQVKVRIVETNNRGLRELGANLNFTRIVRGEEQSGSVARVSTNVTDTVGSFNRVTLPAPGVGTVLRPDEDNNNANGIQTREGVGLTASVIDTDSGTIDAAFRGVEESRDSDTMARPELLIINGTPARINAGGEIPFQSVLYDAKGIPQLTVAFEPIGVNLELTPTILPNDIVKLNLGKLEVSDTVRIENIRGIDLPVFSKRSQTGVVYIPSGQTLVTGGLTSHVVRQNERRVPIIGKLPLIGFPFRSRESESNERTLLIFVSPTVVDLRNMTPDSTQAMEFWKNGTWANESRIDAEKDAMGY